MKKLGFIFLFLFLFSNLYGQEKEEKIKKGFSMGGIPIIAFDQDKGYTYGGLVNLLVSNIVKTMHFSAFRFSF